MAKTVKGKGVPSRENKNGFHGKELPLDELESQMEEIRGRLHSDDLKARAPLASDTQDSADALGAAAAVQESLRASVTPPPYAELSLETSYEKGQSIAGRDAYGQALEKLGGLDAQMVVLDGDVKNSTRTASFFEHYPERSIQGYIAEQNLLG